MKKPSCTRLFMVNLRHFVLADRQSKINQQIPLLSVKPLTKETSFLSTLQARIGQKLLELSFSCCVVADHSTQASHQ
ncbi:hypothetical protein [Vibrio campbellii]|uniref:hypothetical protein n=1 Tax=Vibrio campbellii TaxID=680 RepID=UPI003736C431